MLKKMAVKSLVMLTFLLVSINVSQAQAWEPPEDGYDWIKLTSNEWLKGDLISLYDDNLKFDSEELDMQDFDWEDVAFVRTSKIQSLRLSTGLIIEGRLLITNNIITLLDSGETYSRLNIISIAAGGDNEMNFWDGKIKLGIDKRSGNTDQEDLTLGFEAHRRSSITRLKIDYLGTKSEVNNTDTEESHRFTTNLDWYFSQRVFFRPVSFEYFRDPFQNIDSRITYSAQIGYYLVDTSKTSWQVSAGPGYQETQFENVQVGEDDSESTSVLEFGTEFEYEITKDIDYELIYSVKVVSEAAGKYNHHLESVLDVDLIGELELEIKYILDRVEEPTPDELGVFPDKTDQRFVVSLNYEF